MRKIINHKVYGRGKSLLQQQPTKFTRKQLVFTWMCVGNMK